MLGLEAQSSEWGVRDVDKGLERASQGLGWGQGVRGMLTLPPAHLV